MVISRKQFNYQKYKYYNFGVKSAKRTYKKLIAHCKTSNKVKYYPYTEVHHIKPRCLGGSNSKRNLVILTYQEHIFAHYLLAIIYPNTNLTYAFSMMVSVYGGNNNFNRKKSKISIFNSFAKCASLKRQFSERLSEVQKGKKGRKLTDEEKLAISIRQMGKGNSMYGKKLSESHKQALINSHLGKKRSKSTRDKIARKLLGKPKSNLHVKHVREALKDQNVRNKIKQGSRTRGKKYSLYIDEKLYKNLYPYEFIELYDKLGIKEVYRYIESQKRYYAINKYSIRYHIPRYNNMHLYTKTYLQQKTNKYKINNVIYKMTSKEFERYIKKNNIIKVYTDFSDKEVIIKRIIKQPENYLDKQGNITFYTNRFKGKLLEFEIDDKYYSTYKESEVYDILAKLNISRLYCKNKVWKSFDVYKDSSRLFYNLTNYYHLYSY